MAYKSKKKEAPTAISGKSKAAAMASMEKTKKDSQRREAPDPYGQSGVDQPAEKPKPDNYTKPGQKRDYNYSPDKKGKKRDWQKSFDI